MLTYPDGSIAKIAYMTNGDAKFPKEVMEVFGDGKVARLHNFQRTEVWHRGKCRKAGKMGIEKGQRQELAAFVDAVKTATSMPISLESLFATTAATFATIRSTMSRRAEPVAAWAADLEEDTDGVADLGAAQ